MRKYANDVVLGKVVDILNHRFGGRWHQEDFQSSDFDSCDSLDSIDEIAKLMRQYDNI